MRNPIILFIPVSSTKGVGEYTRSAILAETIQQQIENAEIHFILNKHAQYAHSCPFNVHLSNHSATKDTPKVKSVIKEIRPDLVIFDCAGRSHQFAYAKSLGAKVIFISQHKRKRSRGLKTTRLLNTDLHWVVQPQYVIPALSSLAKLKLKLLGKNPPKCIGPILPQIDPNITAKTLTSYQLNSSEFFLFGAGSGGHEKDGTLIADIFYQAAADFFRQTNIPTVMVFGPNYPNALPENKLITCLKYIPSTEFVVLLNEARGRVVGAGDTLLQAIELQKPSVAAVVSKDQPARLSICSSQGLVIEADATKKSLLEKAACLLDENIYQTMQQKMMKVQPICGLDIALSDIKYLLGFKRVEAECAPQAKRFLFFVSQNYSYAILRPLQEQILSRGDQVRWFLYGDEVNYDYLSSEEIRLSSITDVIDYQPQVSLVPGNFIPSFIPGLKVGIFHGFNVGKVNRRGKSDHFNIRGCFDLYCTQGPNTTMRFKELAKIHRYFSIAETGWSAMDPLFKSVSKIKNDRPTVIMCSTFSRHLTCAPHLYEEVKKLSQKSQWQWLVQFHPKMPVDVVNKYKALANENLDFIETDNVLPFLQKADVMLCDTSSVLLMFLLQGKPVVTFNSNAKGDHLINFTNSSELEDHLKTALSFPPKLMKRIALFNQELHPYKDGESSLRVLAAVDQLLKNPNRLPRKKPINFLRNFKFRKKLNYWKY